MINKDGLQVCENIFIAETLMVITSVDRIRTFLNARCGSHSDTNTGSSVDATCISCPHSKSSVDTTSLRMRQMANTAQKAPSSGKRVKPKRKKKEKKRTSR